MFHANHIKMKKLFFLVAGAFSVLAGFSQQGYTVRARMNNPHKYTLILGYSHNGKWIEDSNYTVEKGSAVFRGIIAAPVIATLTAKGDPEYQIKHMRNLKGGYMQGPALSFVLTNETIQIEGDVNRMLLAAVKGGKENQEWNKLKKQENRLRWETWSAYKEFDKEGDKILRQRAFDLEESNNKKIGELQKAFIEQNPNSYVSLYLGSQRARSLKELISAYATVDKKYKNTPLAKQVAERIQTEEYRLKAVAAMVAGKPAIPIEKKDTSGNPVKWENMKGKYVLLEFWGSWCGWCRKGHPHLKELYAKYKDKGFEILSIAEEMRGSLEEQKKLWKEAIEKDGLPWLQVLNNEDKEKSDAVKSYGVSGYPTKFLLDREGIIIGRYGGGDLEAFDKKLQEIFGD
jgi:thiol-disulfide isomerase/thioredoxin